MKQRLAARVFAVAMIFAIGVVASPTSNAAPPAFNTKSDYAILLDFETGNVLFEKNSDHPIPPASMSKLMTLYLAFERISEGSLSLDDTFEVSRKAWQMGGSKMFVEVNSNVKVQDLLRGIIIQSGNDACIVVAEGLAGSEEFFAQLMNEKARELGLSNSHFTNATGWPDPEHRMSVRDLALLSTHIVRDFPGLYLIFNEREFTFSGIRQFNRNRLLGRSQGVDGLKTGHTEEAGYGLTASAQRDGRRLILVVAGLGSEDEREEEARGLLEFGFRNFGNYTLFEAGETVDEVKVWLGTRSRIPLYVENRQVLTLSRTSRREMAVKLTYDSPALAPITKGQVVGRIDITAPDLDPISIPVLAGADVGQLGMIGRFKAALEYLVFGASSGT